MEKRRLTPSGYARVLLAGGFAAVYAVTYAAHSFEAVRIISQPEFAGVLLLVWTGVMLTTAVVRRTQEIALMGILFGFYTTAIHPPGHFALFCNLILASAGALFMARYPWKAFGAVAMAGAYLGLVYWQAVVPDGVGRTTPLAGLVPFFYWAVFAVGGLLSRMPGIDDRTRAVFLGLNLVAAFSTAALLGTDTDGFWRLAAIMTIFSLVQAGLAWRLNPSERGVIHFSCLAASGFLALTLVTYFSGPILPVTLALQAALLSAVARWGNLRWPAASALLLAVATVGLFMADFLMTDGLPQWHTLFASGAFLFGGWILAPIRGNQWGEVSGWSQAVLGIGLYTLLITHTAGFANSTGLLCAQAAILTLSYRLLTVPSFFHLSLLPLFVALATVLDDGHLFF